MAKIPKVQLDSKGSRIQPNEPMRTQGPSEDCSAVALARSSKRLKTSSNCLGGKRIWNQKHWAYLKAQNIHTLKTKNLLAFHFNAPQAFCPMHLSMDSMEFKKDTFGTPSIIFRGWKQKENLPHHHSTPLLWSRFLPQARMGGLVWIVGPMPIQNDSKLHWLTNYCSHGDFDDHHPPTCFFSNPGVADVKAFALELSEKVSQCRDFMEKRSNEVKEMGLAWYENPAPWVFLELKFF